MQDIEDIIEQVHEAGRARLGRECTQPERRKSHATRVWRYAAALAALIVAGVTLLLMPTKSNQPMSEVAHNEMPQAVKQQLQETRMQSSVQTIKRSDYAYTETTDGVRVYCEDNCNPDEVLARMEMVIKTLL